MQGLSLRSSLWLPLLESPPYFPQVPDHIQTACMQASQLSETLSTCRFAQRMMQVTVDAQKNKGGMSSVHGNLFKLDPVMQQYLEVSR